MKLTPRETQVCRLMIRGLASKRIADALGIGLRTVDDHRAAVLKAYGAHNTTELLHTIVKHNRAAACPVCGRGEAQ